MQLWNGQRPGKADWERKFGQHALPISACSPHRDLGYFLALAGQYKPLTRLPFWGIPSVITRHHETTEQGSSFASHRACHSFTQAHQRVSKAENVYTEKAERLELWVFLLCPKRPGKMIAYSEWCRIHDLWRRKFNFGTRDQAWSLKSFCVAVLLKYKKDRESFWHRHQMGDGECPTR